MAEKEFKKRESLHQKTFQDYNSRFKKISTFRLILTIVALGLFVYFANERQGTWMFVTAATFFVTFGMAIKRHNKIRYLRNHHQYLRDINRTELKRLDNNLLGIDSGEKYTDKKHLYSSDLDLFGKSSLYQLINRTSTPGGSDLLAESLTEKPEYQESVLRQEAVKDLVSQIDWRQNFQATGMHLDDDSSNFGELVQWLNSDDLPRQNILIGIIFSIFSLATIFGWLFLSWPALPILITLIINLILLRKVSLKNNDITGISSKSLNLLSVYRKLFDSVENQKFKAQNLLNIQSGLHSGENNSSVAIAKLQRIVDFLNARSNSFFVIFNLVFMLDFYIWNALSDWKKNNGNNCRRWFKLVSELEVYNSLAGTAFSHESYTFPELTEGEYNYEAEEMGHPLIHINSRVNNSFKLKGRGSSMIITGSNMSGKSTFLRTIGINAVLAFAGGPVVARKCSLSSFYIFTSMRISDDLSESISSFYAELKRLKQLLDHLELKSGNTLYLLDEILRGTNSHDRHLGAVSLVKQMTNKDCFGLVSTHDLELGKLADEIENVENYSFNSKLSENELSFNYKLTKGICDTFNASVLMKNMGLMN